MERKIGEVFELDGIKEERIDKVRLERIATSVLNGLAKSGLTDDQKVDYSIRMAEKLINKIDNYAYCKRR